MCWIHWRVSHRNGYVTLLPALPRRPEGRGRPWNEPRQVLNAILYVLHTGMAWRFLPRELFPPYQTCHRWFTRWVQDGTLERILKVLAEHAALDLSECFVDGTFIPAKKGAIKSPMDIRAKALP